MKRKIYIFMYYIWSGEYTEINCNVLIGNPYSAKINWTNSRKES
jgi:hypothetical protein